MTPWLFGSAAVPQIVTMFEAFKRNRVALAKKNLGSPMLKYHPIFCNPKIYSNLHLNDIADVSKTSKQIDWSKPVLSLKSKIYSSTSLIKALDKNLNGYSINSSILENEIECYQELAAALTLIEENARWINQVFKTVVCEICPIKNARGETRFLGGFSDYNLIGSIFISMMPRERPDFELAVSIVHELGHQVLMIFQAGEHLVRKKDRNKLVYSIVRRTNRPAMNAIHALVAQGYMYCFSHYLYDSKSCSLKESDLLAELIYKQRASLKEGCKEFENISLTPLGNRVIKDIRDLTEEMPA